MVTSKYVETLEEIQHPEGRTHINCFRVWRHAYAFGLPKYNASSGTGAIRRDARTLNYCKKAQSQTTCLGLLLPRNPLKMCLTETFKRKCNNLQFRPAALERHEQKPKLTVTEPKQTQQKLDRYGPNYGLTITGDKNKMKFTRQF